MSAAYSTTYETLRLRTKEFALRILRLYRSLPNTEEARILGKQILRSGTSIGANYRAACRARSNPDFISKLGIVLEEADESAYWLELLHATEYIDRAGFDSINADAQELLRLLISIVKTSKNNGKLRKENEQ